MTSYGSRYFLSGLREKDFPDRRCALETFRRGRGSVARPATTIVVLRSEKERTFAERKATLAG